MNAKIGRARETALAVLRPSPRDLERGLALHADAVVCDAYGFSPCSALDGRAAKAAIEAGASATEIRDMFEEMHMTRHLDDAAQRREYREAWEAAGVTCILQNAGEEGQSPLRMLKRLARFIRVTDVMGDFVGKAVVPDDIVEAKTAGKRCLYLTTNGVPLSEEWVSPVEELRYVRIFFQMGVRMMHLTYNRRNMIGDGCVEPSDAGLSDFGRAAIAEMNRVGVIPDVAHSGLRTSLEAAKASGRPVVASHAVCGAVNAHCRAKSDEVIRAIADSGGYVGVCCVPAFLGHGGDIAAILDHVDHIVRTFGADHAAIGTDAAYVSADDEAERALIPKFGPCRKGWNDFWPENDPLFDPAWGRPCQRESLAWTNWPLFTVGLVQRGHSDETIRKIIGGNVLRVARAALA